jgi:hypothetical protein
MLRIEREALAWSAGVFDGEGWTTSARYNSRRGMTATITLGVAQAHPEMLHRLREVFGRGAVTSPRRIVPGHTPMYSWKVYGFEQVQAVGALLWTWLGSRKRDQLVRCLSDAKSYPTNLRRLFSVLQVADIRTRLRNGESQASIARSYGVPRQRIHWIASGRSYTPEGISPEAIRNVAD